MSSFSPLSYLRLLLKVIVRSHASFFLLSHCWKMPPLATVALFAKPKRFSIRLAKISAERSKMSSAIPIILVNESGLEMPPEEVGFFLI